MSGTQEGHPIVQPRIIAAALREKSCHLVIVGPRHFDSTMVAIIKRLGECCTEWDQGFVDQWGNYLTREEAWVIANAAGQVRKEVGGNHMGRLYSENLY